MSVRFTVYDPTTGRILRAGACPERLAERQAGEGEALLIDEALSGREWRVVDGVPTPRADDPAEAGERVTREFRRFAVEAARHPARVTVRGEAVALAPAAGDLGRLAAALALGDWPARMILGGVPRTVASEAVAREALRAWQTREAALIEAGETVLSEIRSGATTGTETARERFRALTGG